jgi:hypothetical protein
MVHSEVRDREYHEGRIGGLAGGSNLCTVEGLAWCSRFCSNNMKVGVAALVKFRVLPFRVKIQGSLNWLCLAIVLLNALF